MPIIKNIGKKVRMVADRILQPGEAKYISPKQALQFEGIADFEIVDETPEKEQRLAVSGQRSALLKVQVVVDKVPLQAQPEVVSETGQGDPTPTLPSPQPSPKGRGGKVRVKKEKKNG
jgi:hypothetical protein